MDNIGLVLKRLRLIYGDNAKNFSNKISLSPSYLSEIESGKKEPSLEILNRYSKLLDIKLSTLIMLAENKEELAKEKFPKKLIQPMMKKIVELMSDKSNDK